MKNKRNAMNSRKNSHSHVFRKRRKPKGVNGKEKQHTTDDDNNKQNVSVNGSRIINIDKQQQYTTDLAIHSTRCEGSIKLIGEQRNGLASILMGHCSTCQHTIRLETSKR